ncbi:hypothetical protein KL86CLO1_11375 [uncultured Eubacteriales bacterium]|uniref:Stage 0 sporulation protein A homolog n=1 Tax=uncultured Eubacteriales bacterium TaxID=172733 RepID=A0A212JMK7_9FIRM|nr:hypothetical protein KL86CLO1_11375 [uncultured Eubacteriales bacterium]
MMRAIVVDDEWAAGQWLGLQLAETKLVQVTHILQNPLELLPCLQKSQTDVVFLDIAMPELTGLELAELLRELKCPPVVIFVTAYTEYALNAFKVDALDYVVKPVHDVELRRVLEKVLKQRTGIKGVSNRSGEGNQFFFPVADATLHFQTAKCEELFFYLLMKSGQTAPKWPLIETLWPNGSPDKGESNLRTTVFRLNQSLEESRLDLRIKAVKGAYCFISPSLGQKPILIQPFPPPEALEKAEGSLVEVLRRYNFLQFIAQADYLWSVTSKQFESAYLNWAIKLTEQCSHAGVPCAQALCYLAEQFPWQEQLVLRAMPCLFREEGPGALICFYRQQQARWNELYGVPLSQSIQQAYETLLS